MPGDSSLISGGDEDGYIEDADGLDARFTGEIANGYHNMSINTTDLAQGAYFVKTTINGVENQSIKMIKMD